MNNVPVPVVVAVVGVISLLVGIFTDESWTRFFTWIGIALIVVAVILWVKQRNASRTRAR